MVVEIELHPDFEQALSALQHRFPKLRDDLIADFRQYVASSWTQVPEYFGRDSIYTQPFVAMRAKLRHIHIRLPPRSFSPNTSQWDRTAPSNAPDQDAALLYVQHEFDEHRFLILAFLYPDAHGQARQERLMKYLGYEAQIFQDS